MFFLTVMFCLLKEKKNPTASILHNSVSFMLLDLSFWILFSVKVFKLFKEIGQNNDKVKIFFPVGKNINQVWRKNQEYENHICKKCLQTGSMKMWVCICKNRKESGDKLYHLSGCCLKSWDHFVKSVEYWKCMHIYEYVLHSKEHFKVKSIYSKHNYIEPRGQPSFFSKKVSSEHFRSLIHPQQSLAVVILFAHL